MKELRLNLRITDELISIDCDNPYDPEDFNAFSFARVRNPYNNKVGDGFNLNDQRRKALVEKYCSQLALVAINMKLEMDLLITNGGSETLFEEGEILDISRKSLIDNQ